MGDRSSRARLFAHKGDRHADATLVGLAQTLANDAGPFRQRSTVQHSRLLFVRLVLYSSSVESSMKPLRISGMWLDIAGERVTPNAWVDKVR